MSIKLDAKAIAAAAKLKMGKFETYKKYDVDAKPAEYGEVKEAYTKAQDAYREIREDINGYLAFVSQPLLPDDTATLPQGDLITKLKELMPSLPNGGNGKEIAARVGPNVTSNDISELYWKEGQTTLKKAKKDGKVETGLKTRYLLATEADLDEINKDKEQEKADRKAQKSKSSSK